MANKQRVVNFFAGPGAGKSTLGAGLFAELKFRGMTPELAVEWIKEAEYEGRNISGGKLQKAQEYIWAKQHFRLARMAGQVDYVITDSPVILGIAYTDSDYLPALEEAIIQSYHLYDNLNFFVNRTKEYVQVGRSQTLEESIQKDEQIKNILHRHDIPYIEIEYHPITVMEHIPTIMTEIGWPIKPNPYGRFSCLPSVTVPEYPFEHVSIESGTDVSEILREASRSSPQLKGSGFRPEDNSFRSE